jgi:hypothetical protein
MIASLLSKQQTTATSSTEAPLQQVTEAVAALSTAEKACVAEPEPKSRLLSIGRGFRRKSVSEKVSPVLEAGPPEPEADTPQPQFEAAETKKKSSLVSSDNSKSAGATTVSSIEKVLICIWSDEDFIFLYILF